MRTCPSPQPTRTARLPPLRDSSQHGRLSRSSFSALQKSVAFPWIPVDAGVDEALPRGGLAVAEPEGGSDPLVLTEAPDPELPELAGAAFTFALPAAHPVTRMPTAPARANALVSVPAIGSPSVSQRLAPETPSAAHGTRSARRLRRSTAACDRGSPEPGRSRKLGDVGWSLSGWVAGASAAGRS